MPKQLPIDVEMAQFAMEDRDGQGQWCLDTETGEVQRQSDDDDDLREQIEEGFGEHYLDIPYQGSEAAYRDMVEFIDSLTDDRLRELLEVAIRGDGAFRRFKDALQTHLDQRERWFAFHKERVRGRIRPWLDDEDIEPVFRQPPCSG